MGCATGENGSLRNSGSSGPPGNTQLLFNK